MKKIFILLTLSVISNLLFAQPWTYDFGTGTGSFTSSTASTAFLPAPASGTARVRVGTNPGSIAMLNPGISLGTNTELQIASNTGSTSTTKFSVYDYTAGKTGYVKFKVAFSGGTNGVYNFSVGDGTTFSDNTSMATTQIFAGMRWSLLASNAVTYEVLSSGTYGATGITGSTTLFTQSTSNSYTVEIYMNNTLSTTGSYSRSGTFYTLAADKWDLWVDGTRVGTALASGSLPGDVTIDSYALNHQASATTPGIVYLDDIEYSNQFAKEIKTTGTLSALTTTAGTASSNTTFDVSAINLTADLVVTAPAGFEVSTSSGSGFASSLNLTPTSGSVSVTTIYVRLAAATAAGTYSGNVSCTSTGATTVNVPTASSTVNPASGTPQTITFNALSNVTYGDADFTLGATASSGLTVSYASSNPLVATVSGNTVTIVGAGTTTITASQAGDGTFQPAPNVNQGLTVDPKTLTVSGATATNKTYNRNTTAAITGATLVGIVGADNVTVSGGGTFADMNVANGISVTANLSLGGTKAANYTLTQPTGLTANITEKALTITGISISNKQYNGTNAATISGTAALSGIVSGDESNVTLGGSPSAAFTDANVNNGISVTVSSYSISGSASGNYSLSQPAGLTANITAKGLTVTGLTADNKTYDATTGATLSGTGALTGIISGEESNVNLDGTPVGTFADANAATGKNVTVSGYSLSGTASSNYALNALVLTADISKKTITVSGAIASDKSYDGTTAATISGGTLNGVETADNGSVSVSTGTFAQSNIGENIAVTAILTGSASANYSLTQPGLTASIIPAACANQTVTWNFTTASPSSSAITNLAVSTLTQGNNNGSTTTIGSSTASSVYAGASGGNNAQAAAFTGALNTATSTYFEFTLTPADGYEVILSNISFGTRSSGTGSQAFSLRSSADAYASDIATGTIANSSTWALKSASTSFTSNEGTAVTFRLYGYNGAGGAVAGTANWKIDDLSLTVKLLPVLSSAATASICDGGTFSYTPTSDASGAAFKWTRAAVAGISNAAVTTPQTAAPSEVLVNTTSSAVNAVYAYQVIANNCFNTQNVTVTVNKIVADDPADVTACDSYELLPLTVGNYFTGAGGTGTALSAGNMITSSQTIYVYAETGTTPNCTDENSFDITINATPVADDPADVTACDSYELLPLTVGNYFTGPGGTGTALSAGNMITSSQTIYVYAETGTTPNCTDENSFDITINATPVADDPADVTACDSYELLPLTVGNYFTGPGGTGTALSAGNMITSSQTIYVYAETGTTPNCTDENSFDITINTSPVADDPADVTACDSYELLPLTVGNYFTGPGGTGTALSAGNMITSSQTIYVYAETGTTPNCTDENSFDVTINATPVADDPADVSNCGPYTLPALTVGNYFDGPGGTGTAYVAGNVISSDMTMYVYAETGTTPNCTDENSFDITIKTIPTITNTVSASRCGTGAITLEATPSAGTIDWFMAATGGTSGYTGSTINLSLSGTKTYYVEASDNGCVSAARTAVTATIDFCSQIQASQCGATVAASNTPIIADAAVGATHYRFEITNGSGGVQTITKTTRTLYLANFTYYYDSTYAIRVAVSNDGTSFSAYGSSCNITAPSIPATQVQASQCGSTLATPTTAIIADAVSGATHYRFEIDGGAQYVTKTTRTLYQANFTYAYNTTYAIRVAASTDGTNFGAYGASCNITTSAAPTTKVQASQCGTTLATVSTAIIADAITGATHYRFEINGGAQYVTKTTRTLYLGNFTYTLGATYAIRVTYSTDGTNFFSYGSSCNITAPSSALKQDESIDEATGNLMTDISVEAFPNPNSGDFTISASHEGTFNIMNEVGQLIQTVNITKENNFETRVENLQQGVYFVTGTINNEVITKKVMVVR